MDAALALSVTGTAGRVGEGESVEARLTHAVKSAEKGLFAFIRKQIDDLEESEDLLQDVFYQLAANYDPAAPIANITGWLYRVARNKIVDLYRKRGSRGAPIDLVHAESASDRLDNADLPYEQEMMWEAFNEALEDLPKAQREVFVLNEMEGLSFKEISSRLNVPVNTLLSRKHSAVVQLRESLSEIYQELIDG
jgi:RNA polymerase sigma factor (sigma-70 family)